MAPVAVVDARVVTVVLRSSDSDVDLARDAASREWSFLAGHLHAVNPCVDAVADLVEANDDVSADALAADTFGSAARLVVTVVRTAAHGVAAHVGQY